MSQKKQIVLVGNSSFASLLYYYFASSAVYKVVAFCVDAKYINSDTLHDLPVVPLENIQSTHPPGEYDMFIAIGYANLNALRKQKFLEAKQMGYNLATYIHPSAVVADNAKIGENCFIFEGAIIQPFVTIGDNVIIWEGSCVSHHSCIKNHCFLAPRVAMAGQITIDEETFIGTNASLKNGIKVGKRNVIGAGVSILKDTADNECYKASMPSPVPVDGIIERLK